MMWAEKRRLFASSAGIAASRFTLVEMLVVIAIIGILAALLMPSLGKALTSARQTSCANQQKQIGAGIAAYSNDNASRLPPLNLGGTSYFTRTSYKDYQNLLSDGGYVPVADKEWSQKDRGYVKGGLWRCTELSTAQLTCGGGIAPQEGHGIMKWGSSVSLSAITRPTHLWLVGDVLMFSGGVYTSYFAVNCSASGCATNWQSNNGHGASHLHNGGSNVCFVDGHVEWRNYYDLYYTYPNGDNVFAHWIHF